MLGDNYDDLAPMATTFNDKSSALPGHSLCIIPKVGMINLSFFLPVINEILNEITVANYDNFSLFSSKDMIIISLLFITFWQGYVKVQKSDQPGD